MFSLDKPSLVRFIKESFTSTVQQCASLLTADLFRFFFAFPSRSIEPHVNWLFHMNRFCITLALCHCQIRGYGSSTSGEPFTVKQSYVTAASGLCAISVVILPRWGCQGRSFNKAVNLWISWPLTPTLLAFEQFTPFFFVYLGNAPRCHWDFDSFLYLLVCLQCCHCQNHFSRHENNRLHNCICLSDLVNKRVQDV